MGGNKRKKTLTASPSSSPSSPPFRPVMDPTLNTIIDKLNSLAGQMSEISAKCDRHEATIMDLKANLAASLESNKAKDAIINHHSNQINSCEQALRASSIRIIGLPLAHDASPISILNCVFELVIQPILDHAISRGELESYPSRRFIIDNAFTIPSKNPSSSPVIVKLSHLFVRNLIFTYKKEVLPVTTDPSTHRTRLKYAIFEDLTPANFAHFRAINEDPRTTSIWSYNGQIKFRMKDRDSIFRVRSLSDTVDSLSLTKPASTPP